MKIPFNPILKDLANSIGAPLYIVGGYVRDYITTGIVSKDVDICSPVSYLKLQEESIKLGFKIVAVYKTTGTIKLLFDGTEYEFSCFRKERYPKNSGVHSPIKVNKTKNIKKDAKRRDFKCNAVYYDVVNEKIIDPLDGVNDIKNKTISTVISANKVFSRDGLRVIRLARFCAKTGFVPTPDTIESAKTHANLLKDVSKERIREELNGILALDSKKVALGIGALQEINAFKYILDIEQANLDKNTIGFIAKTPKKIRLFAFSLCFCENLLNKSLENCALNLRFSKKELSDFKSLCILLKQALNREIKDDALTLLTICKNFEQVKNAVNILKAIPKKTLTTLKKDNIKSFLASYKRFTTEDLPKSIKDLIINGKDLQLLGLTGKNIKEILDFLLLECLKNPDLNDKNRLLKLVKSKMDFILR